MNKYLIKFLVIILKFLRTIIPQSKLTAIVAPSPPGSLGDEALFSGMTNLVSHKGLKFDEVLLYPNTQPHNKFVGFNKAIPFKYSGRLSLFVLHLKLVRHNSLYIIGADCLDGRYSVHMNKTWIALANFSVSIGLPTNIVSFSFSENPNETIVEELKKADTKIRFTARDYFSQQRFIAFTKKECLLVADLAFSMPPSIESINAKDILKWINTCKNEKSAILIGLNINTLPIPESNEKVANNYALAINQLLDNNPNIYIVGLPHDFRKDQSDYDILELTKSKIKNTSKFEILDQPFASTDIKGIAGHMDFVISGRMHLAIASLSQGIPVYCVVYMNKFEGLMKHLGLTGNLAPTSIINDEIKLYSFMEGALNGYQIQSKTIKHKLTQVKALSALNLDNS
jgi:colanic acid/amylovoran biosynthesis protein